MKKILVILLALVFFFLSTSKVFAQIQQGVFEDIIMAGNKTLFGCTTSIREKVEGEMSLEQWIGGTCGNETGGPQGAVPLAANLVSGMIENQPVSSVTYLADVGQNLGLAKPAYAQGTGFKALEPILEVWKAFRNVAYLIMVIIMVVIGFMIMFRKQINPQTVISIQNALPNIVVTLLLITFSYAIAGLLIDLIYVLIYMLVGIFVSFGIITDGGEVIKRLLEMNLFQIMYIGKNVFVRAPADAIEQVVNGLLGGGVLADVTSFIGGGLAHLIIAIAIAFAMFKLFFVLLFSYLGIVLSVIFAPLQLLLNAIPGTNSFISWLKNLIANIMVFPVTAGMFLLAAILVGPLNNEGTGCGTANPNNPWCIAEGVGYFSQRGEPGWTPPFLTLWGGTGGVNPFVGLIALGMIMMTPRVVTMVKQALQIEAQPGVGAAIVGGVMVGPRAGMGAVMAPLQMLSTFYTAKQGWGVVKGAPSAVRKFFTPAQKPTPSQPS